MSQNPSPASCFLFPIYYLSSCLIEIHLKTHRLPLRPMAISTHLCPQNSRLKCLIIHISFTPPLSYSIHTFTRGLTSWSYGLRPASKILILSNTRPCCDGLLVDDLLVALWAHIFGGRPWKPWTSTMLDRCDQKYGIEKSSYSTTALAGLTSTFNPGLGTRDATKILA